MRIAILGSRGIPGNYGGFETCAEQLSTRMVEKGHDVTVYCCRNYSQTDDDVYRGVKRIILPSVKKKSMEKPLFSLLSLIHVAFRNNDIVLMLGVSASFFCFIPRLFGTKVAINIDGLEWRRKKWGMLASWYLRFSEKMAGVMCDVVITDARWIKKYYEDTYGKESTYIAYGTDTSPYHSGTTLNKFGLEPGEYILYVSRFDPENNPLLVREAFDEIKGPSKKLVMVGDAPFADEYIKKIKDTNNPRIIFTGFQFGNAYHELRSNAYFYIQATEIGGTHPALIEAMGAGNCVLANDVPEHREVLREAGIYYSGKDDMKSKMEMLMRNRALIDEMRIRAQEIAGKEYSWEKVVSDYDETFRQMMSSSDDL